MEADVELDEPIQRPWTRSFIPWKLVKEGEDGRRNRVESEVEPEWHLFSVALNVDKATLIFSSSKVMTAFCKKRETRHVMKMDEEQERARQSIHQSGLID